MNFELWPQVLAASLPLGAILTAVGLSWVVIFRTTSVMNFATGQFAVLGAYLTFMFTASLGWAWWLGATLAVLLMAALGSGTYVTLLKPLAGRPLWTPVVLTMGLAFILDAIISIVWGAESTFLPSPVPDDVVRLTGDATLNSRDLVVVGLCMAVFLAALSFLRWFPIGTRMRAAAESPLLASQSGINIDRLFALGWALSAAVGAIGGISYSMTTVLQPSLVTIGILGLTPALIGGLDSIGGVIVGGFVAAIATNFVTLYLGAPAMNAVAALLVLMVLVIRPFGIFGTPVFERV